MTEFGGWDVIDVTARLFWELGYQNSRVLVGFGLYHILQWTSEW